MSRKPRADSILKTLPPERQESIVEYAREKSLRETAAWLRADGVVTSATALSEFLSWHQLQQQLEHNGSTVEALLEQLKESDPTLTSDQLDQAGQLFFTALAIEQKDSLAWKRAQDVKIKKQALGLLERRISIQEATTKAREAVEEVGSKTGSKIDPATKAELLRAINEKLVGA